MDKDERKVYGKLLQTLNARVPHATKALAAVKNLQRFLEVEAMRYEDEIRNVSVATETLNWSGMRGLLGDFAAVDNDISTAHAFEDLVAAVAFYGPGRLVESVNGTGEVVSETA
jgi:hypothetical protein